ncbi:hypothetical protein [Psychrobacter piscatorii]|uniref:hypothetical protein n=1 Tax=Psychrobacter piscatorii TaxID=554343 RepID=UPI003734C4EE
MKIAFLFKKDSHLKAVKSTALRICAQYHCESTFIGIDSQCLCSHDSYSVIYIAKENLKVLSEYDYVIACLGGYLLNQTVAVLRDTNTKVVSIFPGIVSHYQLDAFLSRLNADQVWLNSKADFDLYNKICKILNCSNNSFLYGMPWINLELISKNNLDVSKRSGNAIFFEQTELFFSEEERVFFYRKLSSIFYRNQNLLFKYKTRRNTDSIYFENLRKNISRNINVKVVDELDELDILEADFYLSISSSAIVEGLIYGKYNFLVIKDLIDQESLEFFKNSNLFLKKEILDYKNVVNDFWFNLRVKSPEKTVDLLNIKKKRSKRFFKKDLIVYYLLIVLSLFKKDLIRFLFNKEKKSSIAKSIDYLNL